MQRACKGRYDCKCGCSGYRLNDSERCFLRKDILFYFKIYIAVVAIGSVLNIVAYYYSLTKTMEGGLLSLKKMNIKFA